MRSTSKVIVQPLRTELKRQMRSTTILLFSLYAVQRRSSYVHSLHVSNPPQQAMQRRSFMHKIATIPSTLLIMPSPVHPREDDAPFHSAAYGLEEYTNSIVASRDTNVSPKEVYDTSEFHSCFSMLVHRCIYYFEVLPLTYYLQSIRFSIGSCIGLFNGGI